MKRILSIIIVILLAFYVVGCSNNAKPNDVEPPQKEETPAETETPGEKKDTVENAERYGGNLRIATDLVSSVIDPHLSNRLMANYQWMQYVYENALVMSASGEIYPLICDYDYSDDGLMLKLTMLPDRKFSDGNPVTIEDVVASIERASKYNANFAEVFTDLITDLKIEGDSVTYNFSSYDPNTMIMLTDVKGPVYIMQKSIIDQLGTDGQIQDTSQVIGSGCYTLDKYSPDAEIVLKKNGDYIPVESNGTGPAAPRFGYSDSIIFSVNRDASSRTAGMIAGDYDFGSIVTDMEPTAEKAGLKKAYLHNEWTPSIFFNLDESNSDSPVNDKNFRKAVRAALDMEAIMLSVTESDPAKLVLNPNPASKNSVYYNDILLNTEWNIADKELAKEYLKNSSYNGETIKWLCSQSASFYKAAIVGVQMLNDIGINAEMMLVDAGSHGAMRIDPATGHDIGAWEVQKASAVPTQSVAFVTGKQGGWWVNEQKDLLIEKMNTAKMGSDESIAAYESFCELAAEEVPWIIFGELITTRWTVPELELNYQGTIAYYWNSYFVE